MRTLAIRTSISARPEDVFKVLTDYENYTAWHPRLSLTGADDDHGSRHRFNFQQQPALFAAQYSIVRLGQDSLRLRQQGGQFPKLATIEHEGTIYPKMDGRALYTSKLYISGSFETFFKAIYSKKLVKQMQDEALALKRYCERHFGYLGTATPANTGCVHTGSPDISIAKAVRVANFSHETHNDASPIVYH